MIDDPIFDFFFTIFSGGFLAIVYSVYKQDRSKRIILNKARKIVYEKDKKSEREEVI